MHEYDFISEIYGLEKEVAKLMNEGWELVGGVSAAAVDGEIFYSQALTRKVDKDAT